MVMLVHRKVVSSTGKLATWKLLVQNGFEPKVVDCGIVAEQVRREAMTKRLGSFRQDEDS